MQVIFTEPELISMLSICKGTFLKECFLKILLRLLQMFKSKETFRDIVISKGSDQESSTSRTKSIHPPIESHWLLPSKEQDKPSSLSNTGIKSMLAVPNKIRDSLKRRGKSQSLQIVLEGAHEPKDEQLVESFRELLFLEGLLLGNKHNDYHTLLRFLRMRDFDLSKAKDMYANYLKWREDYRVDAIPKEFKFEELAEVKRCYPHGYHGVDRSGRPIYIERIGMVDLNALLQATTIEKFVKYHVSEQEKTLNLRFPACSVAARSHIASTTSILDVKGVGMSNFSKPARCIFMEIQKIDSNYYPETLNQLFIVNAGSGFRMLWKALKAFLDARTLAKIQVLGYNYQSNLLEAIDASNLPSFLGGNCTCADYRGCLFSDKGPWNNPEITELLQAVSAVEEVNNNGENSSVTADETPVSNRILATSTKEEVSESEETKFLQAQKIRALEEALKIKALETALEETKMALRELAKHMENLRT
ncbi:phosphatidylinositol/phosphatidylcholine transfer protein SFH11 isoform X2 [Jatropha curcas]|uniref:phosphatidylinositol/phosphatidylcholine transfer protein SFH11 isoform X2 n=1 Tax=Jatropha curcas TaxID=180498 RepID=UPI0009D6F2E2|nr:phosphatidylinositol/phosphatidylcholine transfer protein SFH11 isoform X2 [Jatropha curcas]